MIIKQRGTRFNQVRSTKQNMNSVYVFVLLFIQFGSEFCSAKDSFTSARFLKDSESIVSNNSIFRLGFFSPPNSKNRYVGIWYDQPSVMEVIWVANRNNPLTDSTGVLKLSEDGSLQVFNGRNKSLWSSSVSQPAIRFSVAQLQDSGNLVVQGSASETGGGNGTIIWQSFQNPTDSLLPNMRIVLTKNSNLGHILQSWKSQTDPSNGQFSAGANSISLFEIIIWDSDRPFWRSGPWNGNIFIGTRYRNAGYGNIFVNTGTFTQEDGDGRTTVVFTGANASLYSHYVLNYKGIVAQKWWNGSKKKWEVPWQAPDNECDMYGTCGEFGSCSPQNSPICSCLRGFEPKNKNEWKRGNWTSGCMRRKRLQCEVPGGKEDGFLKLQMMKVPDNPEWTVGLNKDQCRNKCLNSCSCLAYAYDTGIACMTWSRSLIDIANLSPGGVDLYLRLPPSELANSKSRLKAIIAVSVILGTAAIATIIWYLWKWRARLKGKAPWDRHRRSKIESGKEEVEKKKTIKDPYVFGDKSQIMMEDLQLLKLEKLIGATNSFDKSNMLGAGGFGQVFKGTLDDGEEIAVKRLSRASGQGIEEFMNEVVVISKLQHRNLVKLLGCCAEGEEKILIYEYMPNKSLDAFLFDTAKRELLDWEKRFNIIQGICRGLLYLHRDSRLRIIHRDLKASNILLDQDLNPKISDFGMARIFGGNQDQANTERVVGTYGYMSPEYAMEGQFSEKSDVFSFGVLLLEIISGKKNSSFWYQEESLSLLGYAWKLWGENNIVLLIDPLISDPCFQGEIVRCIHVGLLCVQEFAKERPNISTVLSMLVSEIVDLPKPKQPGFIQRQISSDTGSSTLSGHTFSTNYVTVTSLTAR